MAFYEKFENILSLFLQIVLLILVLKTTDEPEPPERKGFSETESQAEDERKKNTEKSGDKEKSRAAYGLFRKRFETLPFGDPSRNRIEPKELGGWRYFCLKESFICS